MDAKLERAVKAQLDAGVSAADVAAKLASGLAASVAAQLGIPLAAAQQQLTEAFTRAIGSITSGPPGSTNAQRAAALVTRLRQMAELATRVMNGDQGQPIRSIAGTSLDADTAKANPAPDPDSILAGALAALTDPAATAASPVASGDGRSVAIDPSIAVASGGDTLLGRILSRATIAGDAARSAGVPDSDDDTNGAVRALVAAPHGLASAIDATRGALPSLRNAAAGESENASLDAFLQAFSSAVARADGKDVATGDASASPVNAAATPASDTTQQGPALPIAIAVAPDATATTSSTPASALPQAQHVDADAVVDQMLRGMAIRTTDGRSEVQMRLDPAQLGDINVRLVVSGGSVDASITAQTADAQSALAGAQSQLAKTLADAGLKLQSFSVGLAGGGFADNRDPSRQNDTSPRSQTRRFGGLSAIDDDASDDAPGLLASPSFGPPIYGADNAFRALNYLV